MRSNSRYTVSSQQGFICGVSTPIGWASVPSIPIGLVSKDKPNQVIEVDIGGVPGPHRPYALNRVLSGFGPLQEL